MSDLPSHVVPEPSSVSLRHACLWNLHGACTPIHIPRKRGLICKSCWDDKCEALKRRNDGVSWCSKFGCFEPSEDTFCRKCIRRPSRSRSPLGQRESPPSQESRPPASPEQSVTSQTIPQDVNWDSMSTRELLQQLDFGLSELRRRQF